METIIASAIKFEDQTGNVTVLTGRRHSDIFRLMKSLGIVYSRESAVQGFLTDSDRFVDRSEAMQIAIKANQIIVPMESLHKELFSEDLW